MLPEHIPSSDAVRTGAINIPQSQYDRMPIPVKDSYVPIVVRSGVKMYRWKHAPPMRVEQLTTYSGEDEEYDWFKLIVNEFMEILHQTGEVGMVEADDDEELTYGAFCTALATMNWSEHDWLLTRMFGSVYEVRRVDSIIDPAVEY